MSERSNELIAKFLDEELTAPERAELDVLRESNSFIATRYDQAVEFKKSLLSGTLGNVEKGGERLRTPVRWWVRVIAAVLLLIIVSSMVLLVFVKVQQPLVRVVGGELRGADQEKVAFVEKPEALSVPAGGNVRFVLRGGTDVAISAPKDGPAKLSLTEKGPAARLELLSGSGVFERAGEGTRECFVAAGGLEVEPAAVGAKFEVWVGLAGRAPVVIAVREGAISLRGRFPVHAGKVDGTGAEDNPWLVAAGLVVELDPRGLIVTNEALAKPSAADEQKRKDADRAKWQAKPLP